MTEDDTSSTDDALPGVIKSLKSKAGLQIFHAADMSDIDNDGGAIHFNDTSDAAKDGLRRIFEAGVNDGFEARTVIDIPGFRLTHAWFKYGFPVPVHAHSPDCLYYVIAGKMIVGTETLRAGDCLFIPGNTPYTFKVGKDGAEILEFRHEWVNDMRVLTSSKAFFDRAVANVLSMKDAWKDAVPPSRARHH